MFGWIILISILPVLPSNNPGLDSPKVIIPSNTNKLVSNDVYFNSGDLFNINIKGKENIITVSVVKNSSPKIEIICRIVLM